MKRFFFFLIIACCTSGLLAQERQVERMQPADVAGAEVADTLRRLPLLPSSSSFVLPAPGFDALSPCLYGGYGPSWRLHEGFNAQFGLSLSAAFGRGAPRGVGFGQHAAFAYALPATERLSFAAGVYASNMDWGGLWRTEGGVAAVVGYRLTDAVSLYAYGTKRIVPREDRSRYGMFPLYLYEPKDRVGAMAEFKLGNNAMIQVSVERHEY